MSQDPGTKQLESSDENSQSENNDISDNIVTEIYRCEYDEWYNQ